MCIWWQDPDRWQPKTIPWRRAAKALRFLGLTSPDPFPLVVWHRNHCWIPRLKWMSQQYWRFQFPGHVDGKNKSHQIVISNKALAVGLIGVTGVSNSRSSRSSGSSNNTINISTRQGCLCICCCFQKDKHGESFWRWHIMELSRISFHLQVPHQSTWNDVRWRNCAEPQQDQPLTPPFSWGAWGATRKFP